jgi:hypothetical protein
MIASFTQRRPLLCLAAIGAGLAGLTIITPDLHFRWGGWFLIGVFAVTGLGAYTAARIADCADQRSALLIILAGAVALRLALLFVEPYLSSDFYRYIWDGRVQASGINPYRFIPNAPELAALRDAEIWPHINRADYAVTIYPPVAQAAFLAITRFGQSIVIMKLGLLLFEAAAIWALIGLLGRLGMPVTRVALYAWHPLPVWEIAGNCHVDAAMLAFLLAALLFYLNGRTLLAGVLASLGAMVKPTALLALPVFWRPWNWRLPLVVLTTLLMGYLPYVSVGWGVLGFVPGYIEEEGLRTGSGFKLLWLLERLTGEFPTAGALYVGLSAIIMLGLALAVGFRSDRSEQGAMRALRWLLVTFLVLASPHYPWYFLALVPFLALSPSATPWVLTLGSVSFYNVVGNDGLPTYETRITIFTLAMLAGLAHDLWSERRKRAPVLVGEAP